MKAACAALALAGSACGALAADAGVTADRVVQATNAFREEHRLGRVATDAQLEAAARQFASFMAKSGKYGHTADGRQPAQRAAAQGYDACIVSENLAYLYRSRGYDAPGLAREMIEGWKQSPEHRKAMLDPAVTQIGVGIAQTADGRYYGVQLFGRPKSAAIRFTVRNLAQQPVTYRAGERPFTLAPRVERTHSVCRSMTLTIGDFDTRVMHGATYIVGQQGARLAVRKSGSEPE